MERTDPAAAGRRVVRTSGGQRGFVTRRIAGETLVIPVAGRVGDLDAIYTLNEVASRIWELLEQPIAVARIVELLEGEYDAPSDQVARDVREFLDLLDARGLIQDAGSEI